MAHALFLCLSLFLFIFRVLSATLTSFGPVLQFTLSLSTSLSHAFTNRSNLWIVSASSTILLPDALRYMNSILYLLVGDLNFSHPGCTSLLRTWLDLFGLNIGSMFVC